MLIQSDENEFGLNFEIDAVRQVPTNIHDDNGDVVRVSRNQYAKMCQWVREYLAGCAYHMDGIIADAAF